MDTELQKKIYALLTGDEDARVCKDIPDAACKEQPGNYLVHLTSLSLTKTGDKFIDPKVTLVWLLTSLGASSIFLSLIVPIHNAFSLLPQMLVAGVLRRVSVRKWIWCAGSIVQAIALCGIAITTLTLRETLAGIAIVTCLLIFSLGRGICSVAYKDVLGKTISKTRRGSISGYADSVAGGIAVGLAIWLLLGGERNTQVVTAIIMFAALCWVIAAFNFSRLREQAGATDGGANAIDVAMKQLGLIRDDHQFRDFVLSRVFLLGTALLPPYIAVQAPSLNDGSLRGLGILLLAASLAGFVSAPFWGRFADLSSRKIMVVGGVVSAFAGLVTLVLVSTQASTDLFIAGSMFLLYIGHAGVRIGRKVHLVDMAVDENRAAYVAVSNTLVGIALLICASFGALINTFFSLGGLVFFSILALAGAAKSWKLDEAQ